MSGKTFLDTNIFVYAIDIGTDETKKRDTARAIIREQIKRESGVISIQVLQEFYQVSTRKIRAPLSANEALEFMRYMAILETVHPDFSMIEAAVLLDQRYRLSFWDALILQAAQAAGCDRVMSEDLHHGLRIEGMEVIHPW